ncbi:MAG: helix-turn-helix domain-containing protein [Gammaproteobacteria bacterium]|nr:helix-turn-helix domain-containing protein [Gammaproteobacteria bacterium]
MGLISQPKQRLHDKHISLNISEHVKGICAPLFSSTGINYFHYGRLYPSGYSLVLVTSPMLHKFFWDKEYDKVVFPNYREGIFINRYENNFLNEVRELFNMDHWLMINKNKKEYIESFGFSTSSSNQKIMDFYLNHQDVLEQFCLYFKEQAKELIHLSESSLLYTDIGPIENKAEETPSKLLKDFLIKDKYLIENTEKNIVKMTKIEFLILYHMSNGLSAKQIGRLMGISFRTVECHLLQVKSKLLAKNKVDVIMKYCSLFKSTFPSLEFIENIFSK